MSALLHRPKVAYPAFGALAAVAGLLIVAHSATAQSATGTVSGRVLWGSCIRAIPLPMTPDGQAQPGAVQPGAPTMPDGQRPIPVPVNGLPAGAVLVAVQNTNVSARTDEAGRFTLSGVPAGQYMTVAAGPVADSLSATAERPNVFVQGGQTVDIGTLALGGGGPIAFGFPCRAPLGGAATGTADATPAEAPAPAPPNGP